MVPFSQCEEAFLFKNVQNVIDIWARGLGQARLNFEVKRGRAELQLFYQLGHPEAFHLVPQPQLFYPPYNSPPTFQPPSFKKKKSVKRRLKDNRRAAAFQARRAVTSSSHATPTTTSTPASRPTAAVTSPGSASNLTTPTTTTISNFDHLIQMLPHLYNSSNLSNPTTSHAVTSLTLSTNTSHSLSTT